MNAQRLSQTIGGLAGIGCLLALGGGVRHAVTPTLGSTPAPRMADLESLEHSPSASLLGELRSGFADYLWIKAERLVHSGVETRAMTAAELRSSNRWHSSVAPGQATAVARQEEGETTVVPNREADHRGILGDLERQIKPYLDMRSHHHREPGETAALFRLMTWANPRFIPAWIVGANVLAENLHRPKEALKFLAEAEAKNPESLAVQAELGRYLVYTFHDTTTAERHFRRAIELGARQAKIPEEESDAWENAHRWLVIEYGRLGRHREAREIAALAIHRFPQSIYFRRALQKNEGKDQRPSL
jgi:tetratricopeptide (TPR) repeat protein